MFTQIGLYLFSVIMYICCLNVVRYSIPCVYVCLCASYIGLISLHSIPVIILMRSHKLTFHESLLNNALC